MTRTTLLAAAAIAALSVPAYAATAPEYKACHSSDAAACKHWRDRECGAGNAAACGYDKAQKQSDQSEWYAQRYENGAD
jgi:hypothetical protein